MTTAPAAKKTKAPHIIYSITSKSAPDRMRLVKAVSRTSALAFVARNDFSAERATQDALFAAAKAGVEVEIVTEEPNEPATV